jgi:hypothetical protein
MNIIRLDKPALDLLTEYFNHFPEMYHEEYEEHQIDPIRHPDQYFASELLEPIHSEILNNVIENRGVLTRPLLSEWIRQEQEEEY